MGRRAVPNAELKIYREVVSLSKSHAIRKIATVDIAYRMRVSESVIFKRFATKEELLLKTLLYCFEQMGEFSFNAIVSPAKAHEIRIDEFKKVTDSMSLHQPETNFILMYLLSDYYEIGQFETIPGFDLISLRNEFPSLDGTEFQLFVKQSLITILTYSMSKAKDERSDDFAFNMLPEIKA